MAKLCLRFLMIMKFNTHAVTEAVLESHERPVLLDLHSIGMGLYPGLCLVNSSCDQNTCHYNVGTRVVAVASRPIKKGEEVCDNYFPSSLLMTRDERRSWLEEHYWFHCECFACVEDLPTMSAMPDKPSIFPCYPPCSGRILTGQDQCTMCGVTLDLLHRLRTIREVEDQLKELMMLSKSLESLDAHDIFGKAERLTEELARLVCPPYKFLAQARHFSLKSLRQCHGNCVFKV